MLDNQADAAAAKAADSRSHVAVNNSTTARNNAATNKTIRTTPKIRKQNMVKGSSNTLIT